MHDSQNDETPAPSCDSTESPIFPAAFECGAFVNLNEEITGLQANVLSKEDAGRKSKMLVKYPEFRIVLVFMRAGSRWENHKTNSRIFVQTLLGHIQFHTPNGTFDLRVGQLLTLDPAIVHSIDSPEESAFLLTLASAAEQ